MLMNAHGAVVIAVWGIWMVCAQHVTVAEYSVYVGKTAGLRRFT